MLFSTIGFWEVVLDVIGLCLCGITIIYLFRNKARFNRGPLKQRAGYDQKMFDRVLVTQLLKQKTEETHEAESRNVKKEQRDLDVSSGSPGFEESPNQEPSSTVKKNRDNDDKGQCNDLYEEAARMVESGFGIKEICERVSLPRAEIDLIINLKRKSYESAVS